jgi:hypothetical protein
MARDEYDDRDDRDRDERGRDDRDRGDRDRYDDDAEDIRIATSKVKPPAICLLVVGIISVVMILVSVVSYFTYLPKQFADQRAQMEATNSNNPQQKQAMIDFMDGYEKFVYAVTPVQWGLIAITSLLVIVGSLKMMSLSSAGWGKAASIIAMLPIVSGCCLLGLPFGIWALTVLANPEVKRGFAAKARARSGGGGRDEYDDRR